MVPNSFVSYLSTFLYISIEIDATSIERKQVVTLYKAYPKQ